jgi:hypothetical protein
MPGKEIKGRSKRANYRHGGRTGFRHGKYVRTPVPHADISKYMVKKKEEFPRTRDELSTMKMPKVKKRKNLGPAGKLKG